MDFGEIMAAEAPRVVVVGASYVDMALRCTDIPVAGQLASGSALSYTSTGPGPNQAVQAKLCGCDVALLSKVGGDPFAEMARRTLAEFNINTDYVYTAEAKNTGVVATMVNSIGENATVIYSGANSALCPHDIELADEVIAQSNI